MKKLIVFALFVGGWSSFFLLSHKMEVANLHPDAPGSCTVHFDNGITMLFCRLADKTVWISDNKVTVDQLSAYARMEDKELLCEEATERTPSDLSCSVAKTTLETAFGFCDWLSSSGHDAKWLSDEYHFQVVRDSQLDERDDSGRVLLTGGFYVILVEEGSLMEVFYLIVLLIYNVMYSIWAILWFILRNQGVDHQLASDET